MAWSRTAGVSVLKDSEAMALFARSLKQLDVDGALPKYAKIVKSGVFIGTKSALKDTTPKAAACARLTAPSAWQT